MKYQRHYLSISIIILLVGFVLSCEKFEGDQSIPAYLQIDTIYLVDNSDLEEGPLTHNFEDVWIYVDDQLIGAFELPVDDTYDLVIPILENGKHKLAIYPGIKLNGMSGTRGPYPFIEPDIVSEFEFVMDSIVVFNPIVSYYSNTVFEWREDFEDGISSLEKTPNSDTSLQFKYYEPHHQFYGYASGVGYLSDQNTVLEVATNVNNNEGFILPGAGSPVFLEIEYNTHEYLSVGLFIYDINASGAEITQQPVVVINPTDGVWKKMYVNFTPTISSNPQGDIFNVFIRADRNFAADTSLIIDNIKLVHKAGAY